tara:strand:+ start:123 stop:353 length:231 start_codon:yes stop_codon:yes gene_type:complete
MTSKEFVAFLNGMALAIEGTPDEKQWSIILKRLMKVEDKDQDDPIPTIVKELSKEVDKIVKPFKKNFPGRPPDIFM